MEHDLNLIKLILENIEPQNEEQKRIKLYLETHRGNCEEYIAKSTKYKERVICLKSIYHSIMADLLHEICQQIYVN